VNVDPVDLSTIAKMISTEVKTKQKNSKIMRRNLEIDPEINLNTTAWRKYISALGGVFRLYQYVAISLQEDVYNTMDEVHSSLVKQAKESFRFEQYENYEDYILLGCLEQWGMYELERFSPRGYMQGLVDNGAVYLTEQGRIFLPLIFFEIILSNRGPDWSTIKTFISDSIMGDFQPNDFEKFPLHFYSFKAKLYKACGKEKTTIGWFFGGMCMSDSLKTWELHLKSEFDFLTSQVEIVTNIKKVVLRQNTETDISQHYVALFIGNQDPHHDSLLVFPEDQILFRLKCKRVSTINGESQDALID
jgi:hypothetical protein